MGFTSRNPRSNSGNRLNRLWKVGARHALYSIDGKWYMPLDRFPGALFDPTGYVYFATEADYKRCRFLRIGERVHVRTDGGISQMPEYHRMSNVAVLKHP